MIVIDSSVWIDHFNGRPSAQVARLGEVLDDEEQPIPAWWQRSTAGR